MRENSGFGMSGRKDILEKHIGEYVLIHTNQKTFAGKVKAVDKNDGYITLNPAQCINYEIGKPVHVIIDADNNLKIEDIFAIETISRKGLEGYCFYCNEEFKKNEMEKKREGKNE